MSFLRKQESRPLCVCLLCPSRTSGNSEGVLPAQAGIQYASPPAGEAGLASAKPGDGELDSHFRGNDTQRFVGMTHKGTKDCPVQKPPMSFLRKQA